MEPFTVTPSWEARTAVVRITGAFTFEAQAAFRAAVRQVLDSGQLDGLVLDLAEVEHLDASALGMILLVREQMEADGRALRLRRPSVAVRNLLEMVHFERLFEIEA